MFWAVGTISEKFTDIRVGYLSTRANVWLVFHGGHLRNRVARQQPSVAIAALVENSFAHSNLIELALFGSCCRCGIAAWVSTNDHRTGDRQPYSGLLQAGLFGVEPASS